MRRRAGPSWPTFLLIATLAGCAGPDDFEQPAPVEQRPEDTAASPAGTASSQPPEALASVQPCTTDCSEEGGYRWAMQQNLTDPEVCGGPLPFMEGCRRYAVEHEDGHDLSR